MSTQFWQAKIWGLLHDPLLKSLYRDKSCQGYPQELIDLEADSLRWIEQADYIAAGSDRPSWDQDNRYGSVDYGQKLGEGLQISHLLSGEKRPVCFDQYQAANPIQDRSLQKLEQNLIETQLLPLLQELPDEEQAQKAFWWLWRCLPVEIVRQVGEDSILLPADTRIPDCSVWSHNSLTAALAGGLAGLQHQEKSRPYLAIFSFTPIQELIKASRKMQDFWAGSWLLHYLSAKVCWQWAQKYGPDSLIYPNLYSQPLIDQWLGQKYEDFQPWIEQPSPRQLLTAGFPNVLVAVLPEEAVRNVKGNALTIARETLRSAWLEVGGKVFQVFQELPRNAKVDRERLWDGWLKYQWQTYGTALALGDSNQPLNKGQGLIPKGNSANASQLLELKQQFRNWANAQNSYCQLSELSEATLDPQKLIWNQAGFSAKSCPSLAELSTYRQFNVGLWWPQIFGQLRNGLAATKNARNWQLPTAFGPRSTVSGIGPVLHDRRTDSAGQPTDWVTEAATKDFWKRERGWFDGREELNATEVVKRGLWRILPELLGLEQSRLGAAYPDLTVGVAGWLHQAEQVGDIECINGYRQHCEAIVQEFSWTKETSEAKWGIPWVDENSSRSWPHPRLLDAGWLSEDLSEENEEQRQEILRDLKATIQSGFESERNPTDWYVLAAGDGDDMNKWLKGTKLKPYSHYVAPGWPQKADAWEGSAEFLASAKRMGPATHAALSRALLDFSNQLVPYLTEQRYAGRLIYSGGDDVLAYTNLWEWDSWLWDIQQCFRGEPDPGGQFDHAGDYWQIKQGQNDAKVAQRPLFTMGAKASISFGIVIAHHSVPLAIALENLWEAEDRAKGHCSENGSKKDAVQVRVLYGNGNQLQTTAKFATFNQWRLLIESIPDLEPALFEQAAQVWQQHPVPCLSALEPWVKAFCVRREALSNDGMRESFSQALLTFLTAIWSSAQAETRDQDVQRWLKLAAFVLRNRDVQLRGRS